MMSKWIYGMTSDEYDVCEVTGSVVYQVHWSTAHVSTHTSFLSLMAPLFENDFLVLNFPDAFQSVERGNVNVYCVS